MSVITESTVIHAVDASVVETIDAFIRFRPGFHGDTGVRDYLYHRLMTNLPGSGVHLRPDGGGTLLAQAEWRTSLKYRKTGRSSSRGRFDLGVPHPDDLDSPAPRLLVAFECGRRKRVAHLLRDLDAEAGHEGPEPADITKLAREIRCAGLPYGYALEFYDDDPVEALELVSRLERRGFAAESGRLRLAILVCSAVGHPRLRLFPDAWRDSLQRDFSTSLSRFSAVDGEVGTVTPRAGATNRVPRSSFVAACSPAARALIEAIEERFGRQARLVFGGATMTVNRRPRGLLLRVESASDRVSDLHPDVGESLAGVLRAPHPRSSYPIQAGPPFRDAVLAGLVRALGG
jgi:hypothetical protein